MDINEVSESIGYCGLVCKLCHLADKCDGCKSNKNCCGKHLSEEGCYQYNCCVDKNISGCWECEDFPCDRICLEIPMILDFVPLFVALRKTVLRNLQNI